MDLELFILSILLDIIQFMIIYDKHLIIERIYSDGFVEVNEQKCEDGTS